MKTKVCKPQLGKTDLTRISKMTEDELEQNARADFDGLNLRCPQIHRWFFFNPFYCTYQQLIWAVNGGTKACKFGADYGNTT